MRRVKKKNKSPLARSPQQGYLNADAGEVSVKETSMLNENRLAEKLGFALTPGSGCVNDVRKKGDGRTDAFVIECKETKSASISISGKVLHKIFQEAKLAGKDPLVVLSIYGVEKPTPTDWILIPAYLFESD